MGQTALLDTEWKLLNLSFALADHFNVAIPAEIRSKPESVAQFERFAARVLGSEGKGKEEAKAEA